MKFRRSSLFGLCVLSTLAVFGCNDPESNAKKCYQASDCGNTDEWKCNIETNSCELRQPEHCINTIKDGDEADVNCGGSCLAKCEVGKACTDNDDCGTGNCTDKKVCAVKSCTNDTECVSPAVCWFDDTVETPTDGVCISCVDGIVNGDETDVDCGGNTCAQCEKGKTCKTADDCVTGECTNKTCTGDAPVAAVAGDLVINEVMSNASTSKAFDNIEGSKQCDFVEIVNITDHAVSLDGVILKTKRIGGDEKEASYPLSGSLRSKQAAVINACEDNYFPSDVLSISSFEPAFGLVNTAEGYNISLHIGETEAAKVNFAASTAGHSFNLSKDLEANNPALVLHNTVNADFNNSPGRCSNNQPFSTGCIDVCTNGVKDGDETDTDCGGSCNKCANDKVCKIDADCLTGSCEGGKCVGEMPQTPVAGDLVINEVMPAADKSKSFDNFSSSEQCDFAEIVNKSSKLLTLDGISLVLARTDKETKPVSYTLSGNLKPKGVALIHACSSEPFPKDVLSIYNEKFDFTNSGLNYTISLTSGETALATVTYATAKERKGESLNLPTDLSTDSTEMSYHSELSEFKHTPGRCLNNGTFASGCFDSCSTGVKDGDETDVDCGGSCAGCELEQACTSGSDCASGNCVAGKCASTCNNQTLDGNETDVDCGGSCNACEDNKACKANSDCMSNYCNENKCTACTDDAVCGSGAFCMFGSCIACDTPQKGELVINEVMGKLPSSANNNNGMINCSGCGKEVEFIELYNKSDKRLNLSTLSVKLVKEEDGAEKSIPLTNVPGCLSADHYLVLSKESISLDDEKSVTFKHSNATLNDGKAYNLTIYHSDTSVIHEAYMPAHSEGGVSLARTGGSYDDDTSLITLKPHNTLTDEAFGLKVEAKNSPGLDNFTNAVSVD
ncbi:MAG: hypothetical protein J6S69_09890 [Proteobacteria bacterium]|nr:hypothetical protein [Pseudomonadota bacterium]